MFVVCPTHSGSVTLIKYFVLFLCKNDSFNRLDKKLINEDMHTPHAEGVLSTGSVLCIILVTMKKIEKKFKGIHTLHLLDRHTHNTLKILGHNIE